MQQPLMAVCIQLFFLLSSGSTLQLSVVQGLLSLHAVPANTAASVHGVKQPAPTGVYLQVVVTWPTTSAGQASVVHASPSLQSAPVVQQPLLGSVWRHWLLMQ